MKYSNNHENILLFNFKLKYIKTYTLIKKIKTETNLMIVLNNTTNTYTIDRYLTNISS